MQLLGIIEQHSIFLDHDGSVFWSGKAAIDVDGLGLSHGDSCYQNDTKLHHNGKALNADEDKYIVVPPLIISAVKPIVMGCQAMVKYKGRTTAAVVGDEGPRRKIGEISRACAQALGIPDSPISGGAPDSVEYRIWPGLPAKVEDKVYDLQSS